MGENSQNFNWDKIEWDGHSTKPSRFSADQSTRTSSLTALLAELNGEREEKQLPEIIEHCRMPWAKMFPLLFCGGGEVVVPEETCEKINEDLLPRHVSLA